jgi:hypothetical protein
MGFAAFRGGLHGGGGGGGGGGPGSARSTPRGLKSSLAGHTQCRAPTASPTRGDVDPLHRRRSSSSRHGAAAPQVWSGVRRATHPRTVPPPLAAARCDTPGAEDTRAEKSSK